MKKVFSLIAILFCLTWNVWGQPNLGSTDWNATSTNATCFGKNNGSIKVTFPSLSAGYYQPPYTVQLIPPAGGTSKPDVITNGEDVDFEELSGSVNNYQIRIAKDINSTGTLTTISQPNKFVTVTQPSQLSFIPFEITDQPCMGSKISGLIRGGTPDFVLTLFKDDIEFSKFEGKTDREIIIDDLYRGVYTLKVDDANGCGTETEVVSEQLQINALLPIDVSFSNVADVECNGALTGSFSVSATGGTGIYDFLLLTGFIEEVAEDEKIFSGLIKAGAYDVEVWDSNGCDGHGSVTITEPPAITHVFSNVQNITTCSNAQEGSFTILASGGVSPYTFNLNGDERTVNPTTFSGLGGGIYDVIITDHNECEHHALQTITAPPPLFEFDPVPADPTCAGAANGSIHVSVTTGNANQLRYQLKKDGTIIHNSWRNAQLPFPNLTAGSYEVVVWNQGGGPNTCTYTKPVTLTDPPPVTVTCTDITDVLCYGEKTGSITLEAEGGPADSEYQYLITRISPPPVEPVAWQDNGLFSAYAGTYKVQARIKTNPSCLSDEVFLDSEDQPIVVGQPDAALEIESATPAKLTCDATMDDPDGKITVKVGGGTKIGGAVPYQVKIVQTEDAEGTPVSGVENNSPDYDDVEDEFIFSDLSAGKYTVYVKDDNDCRTKLIDIEVEAAKPVEADILPDANIPYVADCAGAVNITASNISGEDGRDMVYYNFKSEAFNKWEAVIGTGFTIPVVETGDYLIQIKYADSEYEKCAMFEKTVHITIPDTVKFTLTSTPTTCYDGDDGTITISASGGSGDYVYTIVSPLPTKTQNVNVFTGLTADDYIITVTDDKGCTGYFSSGGKILGTEGTVTVDQPDEIVITDVTQVHNACPTGNNGSITVTASAGDYDLWFSLYKYDYILNDYVSQGVAQDNNVFASLDSGTYKVVVSLYEENEDCSKFRENIIIKRPETIVFTVVADTPPVICNDDEEYTTYITVDISLPLSNDVDFGKLQYKLFENAGWTDYIFYVGAPESSPNRIEITATGAVSKNVQVRYENCSSPQEDDVQIEPAVVDYEIDYPDILSCTYDLSTVIVHTIVPDPADATYSYAYEFALSDGTTAKTPDDISAMSPTEVKFYDVPAGAYTLTVTLKEGVTTHCSNERSFTIALPDHPLKLSEPDVEDMECPNEGATGSILADAAGGSGNYQYSLSLYDYDDKEYKPFSAYQLSGKFAALDSGKYMVVVSDGTCFDTVKNVIITRPEKIVFNATATTPVLSCDNATTDITLVITSSDPGPFVYRVTKTDGSVVVGAWSSPFITNTVTVPDIGKGEYVIEVAYADKKECDHHDIQANTPSVSITVDDVDFLTATKQDPACFKETSGMVLVDTSLPANTLHLYQWNSETEDFELTAYPFFTPDQHSSLEGITGISGGFVELPEGRYIVKANAGSCFYESAVLDLEDPLLLLPNILSTINPCSVGQQNGVIRIEAMGGTPQYTFEIHTLNPATNQFQRQRYQTADKEAEFSNLNQNTYYIRIVDANGCNTRHLPVDGLPFNYPDPLIALFAEDDITDVTCYGGNSGIATVTATGGRKQYTYLWNNEQEGFELSPPVIREPLTYEWKKLDDPGFVFTFENDSTATGLPAGNYEVTVTQDVCNLSDTKPFTIIQPDALTITLDNDNSKGGISCDGEAEGQIVVETSGGTPKETPDGDPLRYYDYKVYQYDETNTLVEFDTSGTTIDIEYDSETQTETYTIKGLESGKYRIEVAGDVECTPNPWVETEFTNPEPFEVTITTENVTCSDKTDGSIKVNVEGGVVPYLITIEDEGGIVGDPLEIDPDTYVYVPNEDYLVSIGMDGKVEVDFMGLSGGSKENPAKTYHVIVQADNGCKLEEDHSIITPDEFIFKLSFGAAGSNLIDTAYLCTPVSYATFTPSYEGENARIIELWQDGTKLPIVPNPLRVNQSGTYYGVAKSEGGGCIAISNEVYVIQYEPSAGFRQHDESCQIPGSIKIVDPSVGFDYPDLDFVYRVFDVENNQYYLSEEFASYPNDSIIVPEGKYFVEMKSTIEEICPATILRIPLETENPNYIAIETINTIDLTDPSIWFETEDPACFNGNGKITVYNPVSDITENILFSIFDEEGNDVVWLALSQGAREVEYNILSVGKYFLDIEDKDNGCKIEAIPFEIGADLPQGEIKNISATLLGYDCATKSGYIEFDVFWDGTATPDVTCTHTENEEATLTGVYDGEKWQYRAELITSGVATITVSVTENSNTCTFDARTNDYTFPTDMTLTHDYTQGKGECDALTVDVKFTIAGGTGPYTLSGVGDEDVIVTANNYTANLEADTYHVKVTDDLGCYAEVNDLSIELRKPVDLLSVTPPIIIQESCKDKANGSFEFKDTNYTYIWDKNNTPGPLLSGLSEGKYGVKITNADNCSADAEYEITIANKIEVSITGDGNGDGKNEYCPGSQATLTGEVLINDNPPMSGDANWRLPNNDRPDFIPDQPLQLTASNSTVKLEAFYNGCSGSAEFEIKTAPLPVIEFPKDAIYIPEGGEFDLNVTAENFVSCSWTAVPDFGQTQDLECPPYAGILTSPDERYELTLTLENEYGCTVSKSIIVDQPLDFFIPNAFTPNGDLVHDTWVFRNIEQYTDSYDVQVKVFVRGGSPVFEGKGYNNSSVVWDGRRNGQDVPVGAYWYVVQLVPKSGKGETIIRTGSVTVIR